MRNTLLIIHILGAATWFGGSMTVLFLNGRLRKSGSEVGSAFMATYGQMGRLYFPPAAIVILITGLLLVLDSNFYTFEDPFVVIGIAAVVAGAVLGTKIFSPIANRARTAHDAGDETAADQAHARFGRFGLLDIAILAFAVIAMVTKLGT